jgi:hypothetical protein
MPERPFKSIKLKKAPAGSARAFPSEINTAQAAIAFVNSLDPETRAKLHWRVAASALNGLAAGQGSFDQVGRAMRHALATEGWLADWVSRAVAVLKNIQLPASQCQMRASASILIHWNWRFQMPKGNLASMSVDALLKLRRDIEKVLSGKVNELRGQLLRLEGETGYGKRGRPRSLKGRR